MGCSVISYHAHSGDENDQLICGGSIINKFLQKSFAGQTSRYIFFWYIFVYLRIYNWKSIIGLVISFYFSVCMFFASTTEPIWSKLGRMVPYYMGTMFFLSLKMSSPLLAKRSLILSFSAQSFDTCLRLPTFLSTKFFFADSFTKTPDAGQSLEHIAIYSTDYNAFGQHLKAEGFRELADQLAATIWQSSCFTELYLLTNFTQSFCPPRLFGLSELDLAIIQLQALPSWAICSRPHLSKTRFVPPRSGWINSPWESLCQAIKPTVSPPSRDYVTFISRLGARFVSWENRSKRSA